MIALAESAMVQFRVFKNPGAYLVDFIPLCKPECPYSRTLESSLTCIDSKIRPLVVSRSWFQESSHRCKEAIREECRNPVSVFCGGNGQWMLIPSEQAVLTFIFEPSRQRGRPKPP